MEEEMLFSDVKIKEEERDELEEAFNELMNQEEDITDAIMKSEILEEQMLFGNINRDDLIGVGELKDENYLPDGVTQFQSILQKYTCMRKSGSKNQWLRQFKSSLARKKKATSARPSISTKIKARKRKIKKIKLEISPEPTNSDYEPLEVELKQLKREPIDEDCSVDANQNMSVLFSDEMLYCDECCRLWEGDCPDHGPLLIIEDASFPSDVDGKNRPEKTSPPQISIVNNEAENGVWAQEVIPARARFGPFRGKIVPADVCTAYSWLIRKNGQPGHCVDATEPSLSNWMRFVNCARRNGQQNLHAFQYQGKMYYRTVRAIDPGEELLVWFDEEYSRQLGTSLEFINEKNYLDICPDCPYPCASPLYLLEHKKLSHGELGISRKAIKRGYESDASRRGRRSYNRSAKSSVSYKESLVNISTGSTIADLNVDDLSPTVNPETGEQCYACPECNKLILRKSHLKRHLLIHSDVKPFVCKFCDKGFTRKDNFDSHVKLRHAHEFVPVVSSGKSESPVKENNPVQLPKLRLSPRVHLSRRQQVLAEKEKYVCNQCNRRFSRPQELDAHMSVHVREKPFLCTQCNKRFINNAGLMMHQKIHKNMSLNQNSGPTLTPRANRMCRVCGLQCRSLEHLTSHEHTHEDRFSKCFVCGKKFSYVNHLKRHLLIHAGYRPHGCPHCEQMFSRSEHLKRHIRTHTRQGAFECTKCKKRFAKKLVFDRHVKLHNEDAPCLQDQRIFVHYNLQKQLEKYINDEMDDYDEAEEDYEEDCDGIKQEPEDYMEDEEEEPLLNVFPEVILGAEN